MAAQSGAQEVTKGTRTMDEPVRALIACATGYREGIATEDGHAKAERAAKMEIECALRIRVLKELLAQGEKIPDAMEWLRRLENELKNVRRSMKKIVEYEFRTLMEHVGREPIDQESERRRKKKEERERRKCDGKCIDCPSSRVRDVVPGETRCAPCGEAHRTRNRTYREQRTKRTAGARQSTEGVGQTADGERIEVASPMAESGSHRASDEGAERADENASSKGQSEHQDRADVSARLPFLKRGQ